MDCIICGQTVINENNRLQKKVSIFEKTNSRLDVKHQWIKQWKICYYCSEKYTNDRLIGDATLQQKIEEQARYKKQQQEEALLHNRAPKLSQVQQSYYIEKYINHATERAMENL